ncbi:hypothetical protein [Rhizobium sp. L1K21]|uniref:hypothetical protein n=1 Tax=Rhizobium sp. L1K21 TaxID=2954933 RepID=UPI002093FCD8|nr:hypothetical protein [Rhizobium sp. L1K21]MCO6187821.1 hypothetical protein [Rhizobium sp. L1K21]
MANEERFQMLAEEYVRLGGGRLSKIDDNVVTSRNWEKDSPEAKRFWDAHIEVLNDEDKKEVIHFLPDINET